MNRIHQVIFDRVRGAWRVVPEHVRVRGRAGRLRRGFSGRAAAGALAILAACLAADAAQGQVVVDGVEVVDGLGGGTQPNPWLVGDGLQIGGSADGSLHILNSGRVLATDVELAHGADGELYLQAGGQLETGRIWHGLGGQARMDFNDATLKATGDEADFIHGFSAGELNIGPSYLAVDTAGHDIGISSPFSGTGALYKRGHGSLTLTGANTYGGGTVVQGGTLEIAETGSLYHPDGASYVGHFYPATLIVRDAASVDVSNTNLYIGRDLTLPGAGTLRILDDGQVFSAKASGRSSYMGYGETDVGNAYLSGSGALWETGRLRVGYQGEGNIDVRDGAALRSRGSADVVNADIGYQATARGSVVVSGGGSQWDAPDVVLRVGYQGEGRLDVLDGGAVDSGWTHIGSQIDSQGDVAVEGLGSRWDVEEVYVGEYGRGSLSILEGAIVSSDQAVVGNRDTGEGQALVSGRDSVWEISTHLTVGREGRGSLTLSDQGTVRPVLTDVAIGSGDTWEEEAGNADGVINIGAPVDEDPAAAGSLIASRLLFEYGAGRLNFNHTETDYSFTLRLVSRGDGLHSVEHHAGATTLAGDSSGFKGTTTVSGGTLTVANALGGPARATGGKLVVDGEVAGDVDASAGGMVTGFGRIDGDLTVAGAVLSGTQGSSLTVGGKLALDDAAVVEVALGGAPTPALFDVQGDLVLDGRLDVSDLGGFGAGVYRLFDYAGSLTDQGMDIGLVPGGTDPGELALQTSTAGQVRLVNAAGGDLGFWDGGDTSLHDNGVVDGGEGSWRADGRNWTAADGAWNGAYRPNPTFAVFDGAAGAVAVDDAAGAIAAAGMQFAVDGYRLEGDAIVLDGPGGQSVIRVGDGTAAGAGMAATVDAALQGNAGLVKTDLGRLVLQGGNSYAGGTILKGGVLEISSDANLGAAGGSLSFQGGALATMADMASARPVHTDADAVLDVADGTALELSGRVAGAGSLVKQGQGLLRLSGANAYGDTLVKAGTLAGGAASFSGNLYNDARLVFEQHGDGRFDGNVSGGGAVYKQGPGRLALGGVSSSDWTVAEGSLQTSAERFGGNAAIADGASLVLSQSRDADYAGVLSGAGEFVKEGAAALRLLGDSSAFGGTTTVAGGLLAVGGESGSGRLGGVLDIKEGGVLGGSGRVGATRVASGGLLAPGNSVGTLHVDGDLAFARGALYMVEVDPQGAGADRIEVAGTATIEGGTLLHIGADGAYRPDSSYRILSAGTGLTGAFDQVASRYAFLAPSLSYDYEHYNIDLILRRNDASFESTARTANQKASARALETLPQSSTLYQRVLGLGEEGVPGVFDALSGELHASVVSALQADSGAARAVPLAHLRRRLAMDPLMAGMAGEGGAFDGRHGDMRPMWAELTGDWRKQDGDGNAAGMDQKTHGIFLGADRDMGGWRLGAAVAYADSRVDIDERQSRADIDTYTATIYGGKAVGVGPGALNILAGAGYGWHSLDTRRNASVNGHYETLRGDYRADSTQFFGELGYAIPMGDWVVEPFGGLAHTRVRARAFEESGGEAALTGEAQSHDIASGTLGLRAGLVRRWGKARLVLRGLLGWRHAFGDVAPERTLAFNGSQPFTVTGIPVSRDAALIEVGASMEVSDSTSVDLGYGAQLGSGSRHHAARLSVQWKF